MSQTATETPVKMKPTTKPVKTESRTYLGCLHVALFKQLHNLFEKARINNVQPPSLTFRNEDGRVIIGMAVNGINNLYWDFDKAQSAFAPMTISLDQITRAVKKLDAKDVFELWLETETKSWPEEPEFQPEIQRNVVMNVGPAAFTYKEFDQYPEPYDLGEVEWAFSVSGDDLRAGHAWVGYAVAAKDHRRVLTGPVFVPVQDGDSYNIYMHATDGKQLATRIMNPTVIMNLPKDRNYPPILHGTIVDALAKIKSADLYSFQWRFGSVITAHVRIKIGGTWVDLLTERIEGKYPDIDSVIPKSPDVIIHVSPEKLAKQAKLSLAASDDRNNSMLLKMTEGDDRLYLEASSWDGGQFNSVVEAYAEGLQPGEEIEWAFNANYLSTALGKHKNEVRMELKRRSGLYGNMKVDANPISFRSHAGDPEYNLLMPVKLSDVRPPANEEDDE